MPRAAASVGSLHGSAQAWLAEENCGPRAELVLGAVPDSGSLYSFGDSWYLISVPGAVNATQLFNAYTVICRHFQTEMLRRDWVKLKMEPGSWKEKGRPPKTAYLR